MTDHPMKITLGLPGSQDVPLLMIGPDQRLAIAQAIAQARATPLTSEIAARGGNAPCVLIPKGYSVCVLFEQQEIGLCIHISVAVIDPPGQLPSLDAVEMIAKEFGITPGVGCLDFWLDKWKSANLLALAPQAGTA